MLDQKSRSLLPPSALSALLCLILLTLAGCSQLPGKINQASEPLEDQAAARMAQQDYSNAAQLYRLAGESAAEPRRSKLLLDGADAALQASNTGLAQQLLDGVKPDGLDAHGQATFELLRVKTLIEGKPPAQALKLLPPPASGSPPSVAAQIWALRAKLFTENGQTTEAVHALVQRDIWLVDEEQSKSNDEKIWQLLAQKTPGKKSATISSEEGVTEDKITRGWLDLARIGKQNWPDREALEGALRSWEYRYIGHPAARHILPSNFDYTATQSAGATGNTIGLALPLTGNFASAASAIQDGFLAGYYANKESNNNAKPPNLRVYDTNALVDANRLLNAARNDNVNIMIGPLQKQLATDLAQRNDLRMPMLALNYTDSAIVAKDFYQFGLAPEDEATAAGQRAIKMGFTTAIALVPEGGWGTRVLEAFRDSFNGAGGNLLDYATFSPQNQDHAEPIKRVLRYGSKQGGSEKTDEENDNANTRGRQVDFIFIAAQPAQARQIRQQLRYYYASRLPVLATSHIFSGEVDRNSDGDLEDVIFADMPWIIGDAPSIQSRRQQAQSLWPKVNKRYPRLFAMGYDAWLLVAQLNTSGLQPGFLLDGNTGELYLRDAGRIQRELDWAQFDSGKPKALPALQNLAPSQQPDAAQPVAY